MERGEVRWYSFSQPDKLRPVLILTRNSAIRYLNDVTVAPITTTIRGVPSEVKLTNKDGLPQECAANFYNLQTVPKSKMGAWITNLSPEKMQEVDRALLFALAIEASD